MTKDGRALLKCKVAAEGAKAERAYAKDGTIPDPTSTDNPEFQIVLAMIKESLKKNPTKWTKYAEALQGEPCLPSTPITPFVQATLHILESAVSCLLWTCV